jgi:hypothetical protein
LLIGKWGLPLLLFGMMLLAGSTAAYLTSTHPQTQAGVPATNTAALVTSECASGALLLRSTDIRIGCP